MTPRLPANMRERLRLATRDAHLRLEDEVDFDGRLVSLDAYRGFLEDFYRFVGPVEAGMTRLDLESLGIDFPARSKLAWIEADLEDLGHTRASLETLPRFHGAPALADPLDALGAMYVLEGSSLGRQVMFGKLTPRLNIRPGWAGRFFNGYGKNTGRMWQSFVAILNEAGEDPEAARRIEGAALAAFASFEACLAESRLRSAGPSAS